MPRPTRADAGQSALSALRFDLPLGGRPMTPFDDEIVAVATLLRHAALFPRTASGRRSLALAVAAADRAIRNTDAAVVAQSTQPGRTRIAALRRFVDVLCREGFPALSNHVLDSLDALASPGSADAAWLRELRAFAHVGTGSMDLAAVEYRAAVRLGRRLRLPDLEASGLYGLATVAGYRGNMPAAVHHARRSLAVPRRRALHLPVFATALLAVDASLHGRFDEALALLWRSHQLGGEASWLRRGTFANLGQLLLDSGHPSASKAAFAVALEGRAAHARAHALSGFALASAATHDAAGVDFAVREMLALLKNRSYRREAADGLLECSQALAAIGRKARAETIRRRAHAMALRHGFKDVAYLAEYNLRRGSAVPLVAAPETAITNRRSIAIVSAIEEMKPSRVRRARAHAG